MFGSSFVFEKNLFSRRIWLKNRFVGDLILNSREGASDISLNEDAYRIVDQFNSGYSIDECIVNLAKLYGTEQKVVAEHVEKLVNTLLEKGFGTLVPVEELKGPQDILADGIRIDSEHHIDGVAITLLSSCNLKCRHCYGEFGPDKADKLSKETVFNLLDQMEELQCKDVSFTGGEVLLHEDFFEILEYAVGKKIKVSFLSNGVLMDEAVIDKLDKIGGVEVQLSIDGHNAEYHEQLRGMKGSFDKTMKAFRMLRDRKFNVIVSHMITSKNYPFIKEMEDLIVKEGGRFKSSSIIRMGNGDGCGREFYLDAEKYYSIHKEKASENSRGEPAPERKGRDYIERCNGGRTRFAIRANGDAVPCDVLPDHEGLVMGNIYSQRLEEFAFEFDREKVLGNMNCLELKHCNSCELVTGCRGGCPAISFAETGKFDFPDIFACAQSKAALGMNFEYYRPTE